MLLEDVLRGFFRAYQRARDEGHTTLALGMVDELADELLHAPADPAPGPTPSPEESPPVPPTGTDPPPACPRRDAYPPDERGGNAWRKAVRRWEQKTGQPRPVTPVAPDATRDSTRDTCPGSVPGTRDSAVPSVPGLSRVPVAGCPGSRASESVSGLWFSEENQETTGGVGSGVQNARATRDVPGTRDSARDSVAGCPVPGVAGGASGGQSPEPPRSPEPGAADAAEGSSSSSQSREVRRVLEERSGGRIRGLLTAESEALFARCVASALAQGFELDDFGALADLVAQGRATWWRSSWSLALLVKNDCHGLVMGLERGRAWRLEQRAKQKAKPAPARGGEPMALGSLDVLRAFKQRDGIGRASGDR